MTDADALLAAIRAAPDDDAPRLIYADWLEEHGQPERAEFIRVQCELARRKAPELQQREAELVTKHHDTFAGPRLVPWLRFRFRRGFVTGFGHTGIFVQDGSRSGTYLRFYPDGHFLIGRSDTAILATSRAGRRLEGESAVAEWGTYTFDGCTNPPLVELKSDQLHQIGALISGESKGPSWKPIVRTALNEEVFLQAGCFNHFHIRGLDTFPRKLT